MFELAPLPRLPLIRTAVADLAASSQGTSFFSMILVTWSSNSRVRVDPRPTGDDPSRPESVIRTGSVCSARCSRLDLLPPSDPTSPL
jgi:hypothetical protein